jgi:flavorubredoxin
MDTLVTEVADGVHQLSTHIPEVDLTFCQYLLTGEEPVLFHTGMRGLFPSVAEAAGRVVPVDRLRWVSFGHVEADESGAMNEWLAAAPSSAVLFGALGCMVSVADLADRPPVPMGDGEERDVGGHVLRWLDTPHVPHAWEAGLLYDATTRTLFCGDLFTAFGAWDPAAGSTDLLGPAVADDDASGWSSWSLHPASATTVRRLAELDVDVLAPMHAPAFTGDCRAQLEGLAAALESRVAATPA